MIAGRRSAPLPHRVFYDVDLAAWIYGTIEKCRQGESWRPAWFKTYREIGGTSETSGKKSCPMVAARTLYEYGRLKNGGLTFRECEITELWNHSRNGTYAILATRLLGADSSLNKISLWREIQRAVRREVGEEPADSNQGGPTLTFHLWHLELIKDEPV